MKKYKYYIALKLSPEMTEKHAFEVYEEAVYLLMRSVEKRLKEEQDQTFFSGFPFEIRGTPTKMEIGFGRKEE